MKLPILNMFMNGKLVRKEMDGDDVVACGIHAHYFGPWCCAACGAELLVPGTKMRAVQWKRDTGIVFLCEPPCHEATVKE